MKTKKTRFKLFDVVSYCGSEFLTSPKKEDIGVIDAVNPDDTYSITWKEPKCKICAWIKAQDLQLVRTFEWPIKKS